MQISTQAYRPRQAGGPAVARPAFAGPATQHAIEQFLFFEAQLLDEARYNDWYDLLHEDIRYRMPVRRNRLHRDLPLESTGSRELAHYDDSHESLAIRIRRVQQPTAWSDNPPPRTTRLITGVQARAGERPGTYEVRSAFLLYRNRLQDDVDTFAGHRDDLLVDGGSPGGEPVFRVLDRTIHLAQSLVLAKNLGLFF
ncbi:aromatic-ring-hydroxylating dioxygenase subunit beta [Amycolatopsis saalfeldensis]|uniref:Biphenyl 2,3-dioxygenase beta subunit n=1 Tax=Amycolatopsis saalfeldensis TaxID=394193 RepID=A0A1H8YP35_9PSEU|nr:3-phenylpropionate/cinnamic acid dioxygenase subunit beta [Amycolatopsis saalfeldensis]SEP53919.1 biphenyl 2,3-dioxygenase beta subunit [Amycolatopsis saalfeldensis]